MNTEELLFYIEKAKQGDIEKRNKIILNYNNLIINIIKKYKKRNYLEDDLFQECILGVIKAIEKFDKEKSLSFKNCVIFWIQQQIFNFFKNEKHNVRVPINLMTKIKTNTSEFIENSEEHNRCLMKFNNENDFVEFIEDRIMDERNKQLLYIALGRLNKQENTILTMKYGLYETCIHPILSISKTLGKTIKEINKIERDALSKLKKILNKKINLNE